MPPRRSRVRSMASHAQTTGRILQAVLALSLGSVACTAPSARTVSEPFRVLLLGDSISIGYDQPVRKLLVGRATVVRPTLENGKAENCAGTTKGVEHIERWLAIGGGGWDVIHFNFGLHDLKRVHPETGRGSNRADHPPQAGLTVYVSQLLQITNRLKDTGARIIFATTTPVPAGGVRPHRDPEDVLRYNSAAVDVMNALEIPVNDLYAFALPRLDAIQRPVNVHFTEEGSRALGEQVVRALEQALLGEGDS